MKPPLIPCINNRMRNSIQYFRGYLIGKYFLKYIPLCTNLNMIRTPHAMKNIKLLNSLSYCVTSSYFISKQLEKLFLE